MIRERADALVAEMLHELAPEVDLSGVDRSARLAEELDLDSFGFLSLVELVHARAGLEVPETDYGELSSIEGCVGYLAEHAR